MIAFLTNPIVSHIIALVLGAIAGYLVLRNNPKVKAALDADTDKVAAELAKLKKKKG